VTLRPGTLVLETERLVLRRMRAADFAFFTRIQADPEVALYIGHGRPRTKDESLEWLNATVSSYESQGLGQLAVERRSDGVLLGRCGLSPLLIEVDAGSRSAPRCWWSREEAPQDARVSFERELGWTFGREHWGHGYAGEAARSVLAYAWEVLSVPRVVSIVQRENVRSHRVAERLGAVKGSAVELAGKIMDLYSWSGSVA
jgi:[ribosomal protein S5]-alanine N-acetyltransferase